MNIDELDPSEIAGEIINKIMGGRERKIYDVLVAHGIPVNTALELASSLDGSICDGAGDGLYDSILYYVNEMTGHTNEE